MLALTLILKYLIKIRTSSIPFILLNYLVEGKRKEKKKRKGRKKKKKTNKQTLRSLVGFVSWVSLGFILVRHLFTPPFSLIAF